MNFPFFENPFACLAKLLGSTKTARKEKSPHPKTMPHAQQDSSSLPSPKATQKTRKKHDSHDDEENALFLRSVATMTAKAASPPPIFPLAERLPALQNTKLSRKQKKSKRLSKKDTGVAPAQKDPRHTAKSAPCKKKSSPEPSFEEVFNNDTREQDIQSFLHAIKGTVPLSGSGRDIVPQTQDISGQVQAEDDFRRMLEGKLEFALALKGEYLEGYVVGLDPLIMENLRAGNYSPEAHIDLHGLNAMQAYRALVDFFRRSWYKGLRVVLVVPGRGKNSMHGFAVLRDKLQSWLTQDPFKRVVLAFCTAQPVDGGPGSVYVLLRKYKKKGKVHWERMPADADLF